MSSPSPQTSPADRGSYDAHHMQSPYLAHMPGGGVLDQSYASYYEMSLQQTEPWMMATVIEDDDLMFGGKPLSAWYEEDRMQSMGSDADADEEERRGRQRERPHYHHHHHHHHHQGHHKHGKSKKESKQ
jgi:hypothetical protein